MIVLFCKSWLATGQVTWPVVPQPATIPSALCSQIQSASQVTPIPSHQSAYQDDTLFDKSHHTFLSMPDSRLMPILNSFFGICSMTLRAMEPITLKIWKSLLNTDIIVLFMVLSMGLLWMKDESHWFGCCWFLGSQHPQLWHFVQNFTSTFVVILSHFQMSLVKVQSVNT